MGGDALLRQEIRYSTRQAAWSAVQLDVLQSVGTVVVPLRATVRDIAPSGVGLVLAGSDGGLAGILRSAPVVLRFQHRNADLTLDGITIPRSSPSSTVGVQLNPGSRNLAEILAVEQRHARISTIPAPALASARVRIVRQVERTSSALLGRPIAAQLRDNPVCFPRRVIRSDARRLHLDYTQEALDRLLNVARSGAAGEDEIDQYCEIAAAYAWFYASPFRPPVRPGPDGLYEDFNVALGLVAAQHLICILADLMEIALSPQWESVALRIIPRILPYNDAVFSPVGPTTEAQQDDALNRTIRETSTFLRSIF